MSPSGTRGPVYTVHLDPVGRRDANYIGQLDLAPFGIAGQVEPAWLHDLDDGAYALACMPFMSYGLALDDVVRPSHDGKVAAFVKARGHHVLRLVLADNPDSTCLARDIDEITTCVTHVGLLSEWHGPRFVAVDVPPAEHPGNVYTVLGRTVDEAGLIRNGPSRDRRRSTENRRTSAAVRFTLRNQSGARAE